MRRRNTSVMWQDDHAEKLGREIRPELWRSIILLGIVVSGCVDGPLTLNYTAGPPRYCDADRLSTANEDYKSREREHEDMDLPMKALALIPFPSELEIDPTETTQRNNQTVAYRDPKTAQTLFFLVGVLAAVVEGIDGEKVNEIPPSRLADNQKDVSVEDPVTQLSFTARGVYETSPYTDSSQAATNIIEAFPGESLDSMTAEASTYSGRSTVLEIGSLLVNFAGLSRVDEERDGPSGPVGIYNRTYIIRASHIVQLFGRLSDN
ncbi:hypothetical protein C8R46DRAFT_1035122 [Mycena filopes]|nr:hypothetical protein C8R46DRAFT_1035122 [Mycena filopes]